MRDVPLGILLTGIDVGRSPDLEDTPAGPGQWGVLKVSAVTNDGFRPNENKVVRSPSLYNPAFCVRQGDLLITRANTSALVGQSCIVGDTSPSLMLCDKTLRLRINERLAPTRYVQLALTHPSVRRQIENAATGTSGSMKNISQQSIKRLIIPVGSMTEMQRIVEILNDLDHAIQIGEQIARKLATARIALVETLLFDLAGQDRPLADFLVSNPQNGYSPKEVESWTGLLALGLGCLTTDGFAPRQLKNVPAADERNRPALLSGGDVLISRANTLELVGLAGRYRDVGSPCIYPDLMMRLVPNGLVLPEFLEIILRRHETRSQIKCLAQGTSGSMVKISAAAVKRLRVMIPDLTEQHRILRVASAAADPIRERERRRDKLALIRQGLLDDLLSGRVRVPAR